LAKLKGLLDLGKSLSDIILEIFFLSGKKKATFDQKPPRAGKTWVFPNPENCNFISILRKVFSGEFSDKNI